MGRTDEALLYMEQALELDPLNPGFQAMYGMVLLYNRRFDDALAAANTALNMVPHHPIGRWVLQHALISNGMREEQLADQRQRIAPDPERVAALERGLEEGGYEGAQRAIADVFAARYGKPGKWISGGRGIALRYLDAGDYDRAIDWLEKAYEEHDPVLPYIGIPTWAPLRSNPRFQDLLRRIGLPITE